jgi:hypothetical protein
LGAIRMPDGHTLITGGTNKRVLEVDEGGKVVWGIGHDELPGIRLAWVTALQLLESGTVIVGNCHAGPDAPQLFEVDQDGPVRRCGFSYSTLPDHAESGEERFLVEWGRATGSVWYDILAFSRPRHLLARLGYPWVRRVQRRFARDSAAAMVRAVGKTR